MNSSRFVRSLVLLAVGMLLATAAPAAQQSPFASVPMQLALARNGAEWKADVRFTISGDSTAMPA